MLDCLDGAGGGGGGQHVLQHNSSDNYQTIISIIISTRLVDTLHCLA